MTERTEEQKLAQEPFKVTLGGEEHKIKILVIKDSRKWRAEVVKVLSSITAFADIDSKKPEELSAAIESMLATMPDNVVDLFFSYAKDLNQDEIEGKANDSEIAIAFEQVIEIAFPLVTSLAETMEKISQ